jgi:uncharacterized protein (DUF305 family)
MGTMDVNTCRLAAALLVAAAATACGRAAPGAAQASPQPATHEHHAPAPADTTRHVWTEADVRFMSAMIGHHAQAMVMARMAPSHGAGAAVRTLASRIIGSQQDEIATMQTWLRDRGRPVPEARPGPMRMTMGGMEHDMAMPGMLTDEQMARLDAARGPEFDRLFLTYMIQHHNGAVAMVTELFGSYGAGQDETVFKFASDVNVDQTTEIARMQRMLAALLLEEPAPTP